MNNEYEIETVWNLCDYHNCEECMDRRLVANLICKNKLKKIKGVIKSDFYYFYCKFKTFIKTSELCGNVNLTKSLKKIMAIQNGYVDQISQKTIKKLHVHNHLDNLIFKFVC